MTDEDVGRLARDANARLIAAAPNLLEACKTALIAFEMEAPIGNDAIAMLKAAIAKATKGSDS